MDGDRVDLGPGASDALVEAERLCQAVRAKLDLSAPAILGSPPPDTYPEFRAWYEEWEAYNRAARDRLN